MKKEREIGRGDVCYRSQNGKKFLGHHSYSNVTVIKSKSS